MGAIINLELDDQLQLELSAAGEKLVVVYYTATWCAPCKKMKPVFEALSKKHPNVVFLKLDVDACQETALAQGVTAMPTFAFHKNLEKIDVLQGADPIALEEKINQHVEKKEEEAATSGHGDLSDFISATQCECMNESDQHPFENAFKSDESYLESDTDGQLIMSVMFQQPVKIHSLILKAPSTHGPKDIRIFINQPQTMGFDAVESNHPVQELTLTEEQLDGSPIPLQYVKYQSVTNIQIFVRNNQTDQNKTMVRYLGFIGTALTSTNMGDFRRISGRKETSSGETLLVTSAEGLVTFGDGVIREEKVDHQPLTNKA